MSGVVIDVETKASAANSDLRQLNAHLASLINSSSAASNALNKISGDSFKGITSESNKASSAVEKLGRAGTGAFNTLLSPIKAVGSALTSTTSLVSGLVVALAAFKGFHVFSDAGDDLIRIQNRLKLVTTSSYELAGAQQALYGISRATNSSFKDTTDVYFNLARAMQKVGASQTELLGLTTTIQQTVAISGGTAQSTSAALIQLNQGLASGTLRGEELNSVFEQLPRLANALQDSLKMTSGQLRAFAAEGNLSTVIVTDALKSQAKTISAEFGKTTMTAAQGMEQLKGSINLFLGTVNQLEGSSARWGRIYSTIATYINELTSNMVPAFYTVSQGMRNYIADLTRFDAAMLAFRSFKASKISLFDIYGAYKEYSQAKELLAKFRSITGGKEEKRSLIGIELPQFMQKAPDMEKPVKTLKENMSEIWGLAKAFSFAITGIFDKFTWLIPDIRLPLKTVDQVVSSWFRQTQTEIESASTIMFRPFTRALEAFYQTTSLYLGGDNELERAWVKLFNARDIASFTSEFTNLGEALRNIRFDNWTVIANDDRSWMRGILEDGKAILRFFNIMDNRLLFINNIRFDRVISGIQTLSSIVKRVYQDVIFPRIAPTAMSVYLYIAGAMNALKDAITDNFTVSSGEKLGKALTQGLLSAFTGISVYFANLFQSMNSSGFTLKPKSDMTKFVEGFKEAFISIAEWLESFFKTVMSQIGSVLLKALSSTLNNAMAGSAKAITGNSAIASALSSYLKGVYSRNFKFQFQFDPSEIEKAVRILDNMFALIILSAYNMATKVESRIEKFGKRIKDIFFDIYDSVVGHSYWPDMVDGVVAYTDNLFGAQSKVEKFKDGVVATFIYIKDAFNKIKTRFSESVGSIALKLENIDYGTLGVNLRQLVSASLLAGLVFVFGGGVARAIILDFFASTVFDGMLASLGNFPQTIAKLIGEGAGVIGKTIAGSFLNGLNLVVEGLPSFVQSFLTGLGPVWDMVARFLGAGPSNNLLYALFAGTAVYALKAKDGLKDINTLMTGMAAKKPKDPVKVGDGILDYAKAILNIKDKVGPSLYEQVLGKNPALFAIGLAAISSSYLKSITLMEGASVGIPLITLAILGKDAGGRAIREAVTVLPVTIYKALFAAASRYKATSWLTAMLPDPTVAGTNFISSFIGSIRAPQGALAKATGALSSGIIEIMHNVQRNAKDYGAGSISFIDMLLDRNASIGPLPGGAKVAISQLFSEFTAEIAKFKIGNTTVAGLKDSLVAVLKNAWGTASAYFSIGGNGSQIINNIIDMGSSVKKNLGEIVRNVSGFVKSTFSVVSDGFKGLAGVITSKLGVFLILAGAFAGMAQAATGSLDALNDTGAMVGALVKNLALLSLGLYAAGVAFRSLHAYSAGKSAFIEAAKITTMTHPDTIARGQIAYAHVLEKAGRGKDGRESAELARKYIIESEGKAAADAAAASNGSFKAGMASVKAYLTGVVDAIYSALKTLSVHLKEAGTWAYELAKNTVLTKAFWTNLGTSVMEFGKNAVSVLSKLPILAANLSLLFTGAGVAMSALFGAGVVAGMARLVSTFRTLGAAAGATLLFGEKMGGAIASLGRGIMWVVGGLLSIKTLVVGLVAAGVGMLSLWIFGPGDTFMSNLEWAKDKIMGLFGSAEKGRLARSLNMKEILKDSSIGEQEFKFKANFDSIDFGKMSEPQYKVLTEASKVTAETIDRMKDMYILQGKLTHEQMAELDNAIKQQENLMASMPKDANTDIVKAGVKLTSDLTFQDNSFSNGVVNLISSMFSDTFKDWLDSPSITAKREDTMGFLSTLWDNIGMVTTGIAAAVALIAGIPALIVAGITALILSIPYVYDALKAVVVGIWDGLKWIGSQFAGMWDGVKSTWKLAAEELKTIMHPPLSADRQKQSDDASAKFNRIVQRQDYLKEEERTSYVKAEKAYGSDQAAYNKKLDGGLFSKRSGESIAQYEAELEKLRLKAEESKKTFDEMSDSLDKTLQKREAVKEYSNYFSQLTADAKEFLNIDFGKGGVDFFGKSDDEYQMRVLADHYKETLAQLKVDSENADLAVPLRIDAAKTKMQAKELKDYLDNTVFFNQKLEYQIKISGVDTTKEALQNMFAFDPQAAKEWDQAVANVRIYQNLLDQLVADNAPTENIKAVTESLYELKKIAAEKAPQGNFLEAMNKQLTKLGAANMETNVFAHMSKDINDKLNIKLAAAVKLKQEMEKPQAKPIFATLQEELRAILQGLRDIERLRAEAARSAHKNLQADPTISAGEKAAEASRYIGKTAPDQIMRNPKALAAWNKRAETIKDLEIDRDTGNLDALALARNGQRLAAERKALAKSEEVLPDRSTSQILSNFAGVGAQFTLPEITRFKRVDPEMFANLKRSADEVERMNFAMSQGVVGESKMLEYSNKLAAAQTLGAEAFNKYSFKSAEDALKRMTDAGLSIDVEKLAKLGNKQYNEYATIADKVAANNVNLTDKNLKGPLKEAAITIKAELDLQVAKINLRDSSFVDQLKTINEQMPDLNLSMRDYLTLTKEQRQNLFDLAAEGKSAMDQISKLGVSLGGVAGSSEEFGNRMKSLQNKLEANSNASAEVVYQMSTPAKKVDMTLRNTGVGVPEMPGLVGNSDLTRMKSLGDSIRQSKTKLALDPGMSAASQQLINKEIELWQKELAELVEASGKRLQDTQVYQAGAAMAADMKTSLGDGIKSVMKGTSTIHDAVKAFGKTLSEKIIDSYVDGMTSAIFKPNGIMDTLFKNLGSSLFRDGSKLAGGNGERDLVASNISLERAISDLATQIRGALGFGTDSKDTITQSSAKDASATETGVALTKATTKGADVDTLSSSGGISSFVGLFSRNPLVTGLAKLFDTAWAKFGKILDKGWSSLKETLAPTWENLKSTLDTSWTFLSKNLSGFWGESKKALNGVWDTMKGKLESSWSELKGTMSGAWDELKGTLGGAWDNLSGMLSGAWESLSGSLGDIFSSLGDSLSSLISGLGSSSGGSGGWISSLVSLFLADGGHVSGPGTSTSDSIPAMLSNGEFVVNAKSTAKFKPLIEAINADHLPKLAMGGIIHLAEGGLAGNNPLLSTMAAGLSNDSRLSDAAFKRDKAVSTQSTFNINITGDVSRQTRAEIQRMIPQIATGVGSYNREKGTRR